jgi:hypothetical protein
MSAAEEHENGGVGKGWSSNFAFWPWEVQFLIACQDVALQVSLRMLVVAIIEAAMTLLFFMHLWDNRGLKLGAFR